MTAASEATNGETDILVEDGGWRLCSYSVYSDSICSDSVYSDSVCSDFVCSNSVCSDYNIIGITFCKILFFPNTFPVSITDLLTLILILTEIVAKSLYSFEITTHS